MSANRILVRNVSRQVNESGLKEFFNCCGTVVGLKYLPASQGVETNSCIVEFEDPAHVETALMLNGTPLCGVAIAISKGTEDGGTGAAATEERKGGYPAPTSALHNSLQMQYAAPQQSTNNMPIASIPSVDLISGTGESTDKEEEIARTVYAGNLDSKVASADALLEYLSIAGPVAYVKMAGDPTQSTRFAFVEFVNRASIQHAMALSGAVFNGMPLKVNHSKNAIVKAPLNKQAPEYRRTEVHISKLNRRLRHSGSRDDDRSSRDSSRRRRHRRHRHRHHSRSRSRSRSPSRSSKRHRSETRSDR